MSATNVTMRSASTYHEFDSSPSPQSYARGLPTKETGNIRSTEAQVTREKPRKWLDRQKMSYIDTKPNNFSGRDRHIVQELTEHQLLLLHPETPVYGLKLKQWSEYSPAFCIYFGLIASSDDNSGLYSGDCPVSG